MPDEAITYEHEPESLTAPPDLRALAAKVESLSHQIDSLFGNDSDLRQLFFEKILPLIHEAEERKI
ncbi:unnamed protein product, partial [marine sediment metagenome]